MSRAGGDDYEEDFAGQAALWQANARRALKGKRGRKALAEFREALLALPERRLIANACSTVGKQVPDAPETAPTPMYGDPGFDHAAYRAQRDAFEQKELVDEQGEGLCSVAAYVWHQRVKAGADPQQAMVDLPLHPNYEGESYETPRLGEAAGLSSYVAWELMWVNDEKFVGLTPEARWLAVMEWIDQELGTTADA